MEYRTEKDSLGEVKVPVDAYWGAQTQRAVENFPISGQKAHRAFIRASAEVKKAACVTNTALGLVNPEHARVIIRACDEIIEGKFDDQFAVDIFQAGAGTSHNMNTNEVIANRANEILGHKKGEYKPVHPNDTVNMSQSTNDFIPTAIRIASLQLRADLKTSLETMKSSLSDKSIEFNDIVKSARTHLQDAVPIRLGQEFSGYARSVERHIEWIEKAFYEMEEIGLGGSAAGTGLNCHPDYRMKVAENLARQTGFDIRPARNYFEAMQSMAPFVGLSGALRNFAQDLSRIANDIRLLSSGPKTGLGELLLPPRQPGSSMMPGKVNPVIAEMTNMVCFAVIGNDESILWASQAGQMDLNVMMPLIAYKLPESITILTNAVDAFTRFCIDEIKADPEKCKAYAESSAAIVTALNPVIGYMKAAEVAKRSFMENKTVREILLEEKLVDPVKIDKILDLRKLTDPGINK
ncbi:MAG: aspartate ammonia-lyase [Candidatus Zixiibacteriota bacterium]|nr:MAG: aspartate ammonia-lyase [candidate division Zixibacteria bacterium]